MIDEKVIGLAQAHYKNSSEPLLLAEFGKMLRQASLWPQERKQKLFDYVCSLQPSVNVVRDPESPAYAVVVVDGKQHIAAEAIRLREERAYLESFPLSFLVAFAANVVGKQKVYLQISEPHRYVRSSESPGDDYLEVQEDLRHPGLNVKDIILLPQEKILTLAASVRAWLANNELSDALFKTHLNTPKKVPLIEPRPPKTALSPEFKAGSALHRLYAAQPPDIADKMVIPLDIANYLSRID